MEATPTAAAAAAGEGAEAAGAFAGKDGATRPSTTPEEEALKRNTDCVYFLASPLTCKKGAECEYRHSEGARVNPRDCYYWLNSNCLNPKCSFRHPPLEGLFGTATTASGPLPPPQAVTPAQAASYSSRQSVPCYYFQRGQCLKGDRCAFMHGATPMANPAQQQTPKIAATQVSEPQQVLKKPSWAVEKCNQNILKDNVAVPAKVANVTKRIPALGTGSAVSNGLVVKNNVQIKTELPSRSEIKNVPIGFGNVPNRLQTHRSDLADEQLQTERDGDEFIQESSPGFDVLVDDENEDPGYYHNEDEYRDPSGNDGRSFKPITEFDYSHKFEYENAARFSRERQREEGEYDDHVQLRDYYDRERRVSSSDLTLERASASKRSRMDTVSDVDGSDLRHRLLKQRRFNERRPGVGPDQPSELHRPTDRHAEEHRYRSRRHHDDQHHTSGRISVSKRLQGRISLPGRMPAQPDADILDKVTDTGRDWVGRSSVGRTSSNQGRNRVRQRSSEEIPSGVRRPASHVVKSEEVEKPGFVRPKRLSELKGTNDSESSDQRSSRVTKDVPSTEQKDMRLRRALGNHQETEPATFEGPKSLSDILKRKREAAALSHHKADSETDGHGHSADSMSATAMPVKEAGSISPLQDAAGEREKEEGIIPTDEERQDPVADANDSEYIEAENGEYDQGEGEYAYEQNEDGEEYYYEDEEGVYQEEGAYQEDGAYQEEGMMEQEEGAYQEDGTYQDEDGMIEQEEGAYQDEEGMMEQEDGSADFVGKLDEPMPN